MGRLRRTNKIADVQNAEGISIKPRSSRVTRQRTSGETKYLTEAQRINIVSTLMTIAAVSRQPKHSSVKETDSTTTAIVLDRDKLTAAVVEMSKTVPRNMEDDQKIEILNSLYHLEDKIVGMSLIRDAIYNVSADYFYFVARVEVSDNWGIEYSNYDRTYMLTMPVTIRLGVEAEYRGDPKVFVEIASTSSQNGERPEMVIKCPEEVVHYANEVSGSHVAADYIGARAFANLSMRVPNLHAREARNRNVNDLVATTVASNVTECTYSVKSVMDRTLRLGKVLSEFTGLPMKASVIPSRSELAAYNAPSHTYNVRHAIVSMFCSNITDTLDKVVNSLGVDDLIENLTTEGDNRYCTVLDFIENKPKLTWEIPAKTLNKIKEVNNFISLAELDRSRAPDSMSVDIARWVSVTTMSNNPKEVRERVLTIKRQDIGLMMISNVAYNVVGGQQAGRLYRSPEGRPLQPTEFSKENTIRCSFSVRFMDSQDDCRRLKNAREYGVSQSPMEQLSSMPLYHDYTKAVEYLESVVLTAAKGIDGEQYKVEHVDTRLDLLTLLRVNVDGRFEEVIELSVVVVYHRKES